MPPINTVKNNIRWLIPFLITAFTFAVFLPALDNGFVNWDDIQNLVQNPRYRGLGWEQLKWMFTTFHMGPYQPLSWMTLGFDYLVWGMDPFGYHLTNVVLHSINALIFYFLCVRLLASGIQSSINDKEVLISAGFAAFFFALHPLRAESVAWVTERRDVLSGLFYILTILWYISPRTKDGTKAPFWRRHLLPITAFLFSLLSKGMGISLPVILIALDFYPLRRIPSDTGRWFSPEHRELWLEKLPYFGLAATFGLIGYLGQATTKVLMPSQQYGFAAHAAELPVEVLFYIWKTLIPLHLSPVYRLPAGFSPTHWLSVLGITLFLTITTILISIRRRFPAGLIVWLCYLASLSPIILLIRTLADRYTYLPCMGFAVLAGAGFLKCRQTGSKSLKSIGTLAAFVIIAGLVSLTWRQEKIWLNSETLWSHALAMDPDVDLAHYNLGQFFTEQGQFAEAIRQYRETLKVNPNYPGAHLNLGVALAAQGDLEEATVQYLEALKDNPGSADARNDLGVALARQGKPEEAVKQYLEALKLNPELAQTHNNLGAALTAQGKLNEAVKHYHEALRIDPNYTNARLNLNDVQIAQNKLNKTNKP